MPHEKPNLEAKMSCSTLNSSTSAAIVEKAAEVGSCDRFLLPLVYSKYRIK